MAELPGIPNVIPEVRAPTSRVSPGQIAQPYNELAASLDKIGEVLDKDVAQPLATKAGLQAVQRDASGNVTVAQAPIVGDAALAYKRAVKFAALADGEGVARFDDVERRQKYRDNPDAYLAASKKYHDEKVKQYTDVAGPEVGISLGRVISEQTTLTYKGLLNDKSGLDLKRSTERIWAEIGETTNELAGIVAGGGDDTPAFKTRVAKIQRSLSELVDNPLIAYPPEKAKFELDQIKSELGAQATIHRISEIYDKDGEAAALKAADSIRTDPSYNLTAGQRENYANRAIGVINQKRRSQDLTEDTIKGAVDQVNKIVADGDRPTQDRLAALRQAMVQNKNPALESYYRQSVEDMSTVVTWQQMNPAQLSGELSRLDQRIAREGTNERTNALRAVGQRLLTTMNKELAADPLGWANKTGVVPVPLIDFSAPTAKQEMQVRTSIADTVARQYGIAPTYLRPEEVRALQVQTAAGGKPMLDAAKGIADGFGERSGAVLDQVSKDAPVLAHIGGLLSGGLFGGGTQVFANDVAEAEGLKADPEKSKHLPKWVKEPNDRVHQFEDAHRVDQYGDAFLMVPDNGRAAEQSSRAAFIVRSYRNGYDPNSLDIPGSATGKAYNRTLQEGAGASFDTKGNQFGGVTDYSSKGYFPWSASNKVLVPGYIRADKFKDVIGAIRDEDLSKLAIGPQTVGGKPYAARDLQSAIPVATAGGYRFAHGDPASSDPKWVRGEDGNPFVLNLDKLDDVLRARVPGAFSGAR